MTLQTRSVQPGAIATTSAPGSDLELRLRNSEPRRFRTAAELAAAVSKMANQIPTTSARIETSASPAPPIAAHAMDAAAEMIWRRIRAGAKS